ncbi:MAG: hypothetical protein QMC99_05395 [Methanocella conradii]|nr:hypothetical protein [Methanocella conradii]MDI6896745.1 hypothetical protein [Methanocella conradii]
MESNSVVMPQVEKSVDMKLYQRAADALTCLDWNENDSWSSIGPIKEYVANWDGSEANLSSEVSPCMDGLDHDISSMMPPHVLYNLNLTYFNETDKHSKMVISHGKPSDNSVTSTCIVTLNEGDKLSHYWENEVLPLSVEVKLTCWYI